MFRLKNFHFRINDYDDIKIQYNIYYFEWKKYGPKTLKSSSQRLWLEQYETLNSISMRRIASLC